MISYRDNLIKRINELDEQLNHLDNNCVSFLLRGIVKLQWHATKKTTNGTNRYYKWHLFRCNVPGHSHWVFRKDTNHYNILNINYWDSHIEKWQKREDICKNIPDENRLGIMDSRFAISSFEEVIRILHSEGLIEY
jgi:hypothetical protein